MVCYGITANPDDSYHLHGSLPDHYIRGHHKKVQGSSIHNNEVESQQQSCLSRCNADEILTGSLTVRRDNQITPSGQNTYYKHKQ